MNYEEAADKIISVGINRVIDVLTRIVPNLNKYPEVWNQIPIVARPFINLKYIMGWITKIHEIIPYIPKMDKYIIVQEMKTIMDSLEDAYVSSILHGNTNKELALDLEGIGELIYNGI